MLICTRIVPTTWYLVYDNEHMPGTCYRYKCISRDGSMSQGISFGYLGTLAPWITARNIDMLLWSVQYVQSTVYQEQQAVSRYLTVPAASTFSGTPRLVNLSSMYRRISA